MKANFDREKALQALLYVSKKAQIPDSIHLNKILFFAEKAHLEKYGRMIFHDDYKKITWGAIPTRIYDLIKAIRKIGSSHFRNTNAEYVDRVIRSFKVEGSDGDAPIRALVEPDLSYLSKSDLKCIDAAIEEIGPMSFKDLDRKCHIEDKVWGVSQGHNIPIELIISTMPDNEPLREYISNTA